MRFPKFSTEFQDVFPINLKGFPMGNTTSIPFCNPDIVCPTGAIVGHNFLYYIALIPL
jgi:hypothetical protein